MYSGWLGVIYDSQATNSNALAGVVGPYGESSLLPIGSLEVICDSQPHGYALFIATRIRVKDFKGTSCRYFGFHVRFYNIKSVLYLTTYGF